MVTGHSFYASTGFVMLCMSAGAARYSFSAATAFVMLCVAARNTLRIAALCVMLMGAALRLR